MSLQYPLKIPQRTIRDSSPVRDWKPSTSWQPLDHNLRPIRLPFPEQEGSPRAPYGKTPLYLRLLSTLLHCHQRRSSPQYRSVACPRRSRTTRSVHRRARNMKNSMTPFRRQERPTPLQAHIRSKAAFGSSELDVTRGQLGEVLASPKMIDSSQSQYMSMYGPLSPFRLNKRMTLLLDDELVPSSQSQENELGMSQLLPLERYALLLLSFLYLADSIPQNPFSAEEKLIPFS
jgi:hypothetical protein